MSINKKYISDCQTRWCVKIRLESGLYRRSFSFKKYGGKCKTLKIAIEYRDYILRINCMSDLLNYEKRPDMFAHETHTNPIIGIYQNNNNGHENWTTNIQRNKKIKKCHFSIKKYGNKKAFLLACYIRYSVCGKLIVINKNKMPIHPDVPFMYKK